MIPLRPPYLCLTWHEFIKNFIDNKQIDDATTNAEDLGMLAKKIDVLNYEIATKEITEEQYWSHVSGQVGRLGLWCRRVETELGKKYNLKPKEYEYYIGHGDDQEDPKAQSSFGTALSAHMFLLGWEAHSQGDDWEW